MLRHIMVADMSLFFEIFFLFQKASYYISIAYNLCNITDFIDPL